MEHVRQILIEMPVETWQALQELARIIDLGDVQRPQGYTPLPRCTQGMDG